MTATRSPLLTSTLIICLVKAQAQPLSGMRTVNMERAKTEFLDVAYADKLPESTLDSYPPDDPLQFNPNQKSTENTVTFLDGKTAKYRAYETIYYVANVADLAYQYLNVFIPESAYANSSKPSIFLKTYVGGYFSSKAQAPVNTDASGRALQEGYLVVIPGALGPDATPENQVFGDATGKPANYTDFTLRGATGNPSATVDKAIKDRVYLLNPMNFIGDAKGTTTKHWYIRHGASDRDTGFPIPINLYKKLVNRGYQVGFALPWNRGHSSDYNLDEVFAWIDSVVKTARK